MPEEKAFTAESAENAEKTKSHSFVFLRVLGAFLLGENVRGEISFLPVQQMLY